MVKRQFSASGPNHLGVADMTYASTWSESLHLVVTGGYDQGYGREGRCKKIRGEEMVAKELAPFASAPDSAPRPSTLVTKKKAAPKKRPVHCRKRQSLLGRQNVLPQVQWRSRTKTTSTS